MQTILPPRFTSEPERRAVQGIMSSRGSLGRQRRRRTAGQTGQFRLLARSALRFG